MQHLDRHRVRRLARELAGRIVVEPAAINDAHAALADCVADDDGAPADVELASGLDAGLELGLLAERHAALRAEAGAVLDDAPAARTDGHVATIAVFCHQSWAARRCELSEAVAIQAYRSRLRSAGGL